MGHLFGADFQETFASRVRLQETPKVLPPNTPILIVRMSAGFLPVFAHQRVAGLGKPAFTSSGVWKTIVVEVMSWSCGIILQLSEGVNTGFKCVVFLEIFCIMNRASLESRREKNPYGHQI